MKCIVKYIPSSWSVSDCKRFFTEYTSIALMMGGSVEFSVFTSEKTYFPPVLVNACLLYKVTADK